MKTEEKTLLTGGGGGFSTAIKEALSSKLSSRTCFGICQTTSIESNAGQMLKRVQHDRNAFTMAGAGQRTLITGLRACGHAFTMAEILLSLTIIGVVAAITLPSLTGNINERTWNTQRKALYARFSQAIALMPALNGYGVGATEADTINKATETFITSGLSKVLKINNICGNDNLYDCGFASKFTDGGGAKQNLPTEIRSLNHCIVDMTFGAAYSVINTKAAAFETANGESILTFYNPKCTAENVLKHLTISGMDGDLVKQHVCVNFFYDLNGKKGPNTVGKDIGTMAAIYSSDSVVVMPMYPKGIGDGDYETAVSSCRDLEGGEYRLPNKEEVLAVYYNRLIYSDDAFGSGDFAWSSSLVDSDSVYAFGNNSGIRYKRPKTATDGRIFCVKR